MQTMTHDPRPADRLTHAHVDDAIARSERSDAWQRRLDSIRRFGRAVRWLLSPLMWFVRNAKDILVALAAVSSLVLVADQIDLLGFNLSSLPARLGDTVQAIDENS